jgi:hypothetical protein
MLRPYGMEFTQNAVLSTSSVVSKNVAAELRPIQPQPPIGHTEECEWYYCGFRCIPEEIHEPGSAEDGNLATVFEDHQYICDGVQ